MTIQYHLRKGRFSWCRYLRFDFLQKNKQFFERSRDTFPQVVYPTDHAVHVAFISKDSALSRLPPYAAE